MTDLSEGLSPRPARPTIEAEWARCKGWLEAALDEDTAGYFNIDDVWDSVASGEATFWPGKTCAVITKFLQYPRQKVINVWLVGGDMRELVEGLMPCIEVWAIQNDCTEALGRGRKGWERAVRAQGFEPVGMSYRKILGLRPGEVMN